MSSRGNKQQNSLQELHIELQNLLSGYADDALDKEDIALVEAHLAGCEACRMDVARQKILSNKLHSVPATRMSEQLHEKLDRALEEATDESKPIRKNKKVFHDLPIMRWLRKIQKPILVAASGWGVALILMFVVFKSEFGSVLGHEIPMVQDVLAEYRLVSKEDLPMLEQSSTVTPPASWPNSRVLSSWKTVVSGMPADAYAVRNGDTIVIQFRVDESVFFRNPDVRLSVENAGYFQTEKSKLQILALPLKNAGLLMVGPINKMPAIDKLTYKAI